MQSALSVSARTNCMGPCFQHFRVDVIGSWLHDCWSCRAVNGHAAPVRLPTVITRKEKIYHVVLLRKWRRVDSNNNVNSCLWTVTRKSAFHSVCKPGAAWQRFHCCMQTIQWWKSFPCLCTTIWAVGEQCNAFFKATTHGQPIHTSRLSFFWGYTVPKFITIMLLSVVSALFFWKKPKYICMHVSITLQNDKQKP